MLICNCEVTVITMRSKTNFRLRLLKFIFIYTLLEPTIIFFLLAKVKISLYAKMECLLDKKS